MSAKPAMRVLVSGAGIAGPTVAFFLAKAGAQVTVVDRAPALLPHGQNIDVHGSAVSIIKKMGLMDQLRRYNTNEKGGQLVDTEGKAYACFPLRDGGRASPTSEFEILRGDLSKILYEPTADHPNVTYLFSTTVARILSDGDKSVEVELSNGDVRAYDVLVLADGQWSPLRRAHFPREDLTVVDKNMYAVYFTIPREPADNDLWNIHVAPGARIVTTRPDPHGTYRAMFTRVPRAAADKAAWDAAARSRDPAAQQALVRREFADVAGGQAPRLLRGMAAAPDFYFQSIQQIRMRRWHRGRVVLLGDTAYCPTPLTGQGASLAILGAYVLAGELGRLAEGGAPGPCEHPRAALEAYEGLFRPWVEEQQKIPSIFPGVMHPETGLHKWALESFLWAFSRILNMPWVLRWISSHSPSEETEDFKLPHYPKFER